MGWMHDMLEYVARGSGPPPLAAQPGHVLDALHATPRTSSCRSRTTRSCTARARCSTRCRATSWQKYATLRALYGYMYGHPGQEAAVHGRRVRPVARVEPRSQPRLAPARRSAARRRCGATCRTLNWHYHARAGAARSATSIRPASAGSTATTTRTASSSFVRYARDRDDFVVMVFNFTPVPRADYRIGVPAAGYYAELLNSDSADLRRQQRRQRRRRRQRADRRARLRSVARA